MRRLRLLHLLLGMLAGFPAPTVGEFYAHGDAANDQSLAYSMEQSAIALDMPVVFMEKSVDELYLSHNGIVGIGQKLPESIEPLQKIKHSAIAVYYAPASEGNIYYRVTSSDQGLLKKLTDDVRAAFADAAEFTAIQAIVVTWKGIQNAEKDGAAAFQLVLTSDGSSTYSIMHFDTLPWSSSMGYYAQSGFVHSEGKYQPNVNSGGPDVKELNKLSNDHFGNSFMYRVSGSSIEDPREDGGDYEYNNYDHDYDGESREAPADCPKDMYANKCPEQCSMITDSRGCSRCICAESPSSENEVDEKAEGATVVIPTNAPSTPSTTPAQKQQQQQQQHQQKQRQDQQQQKLAPEVPIQEQSNPLSCANRLEGTCHSTALCQDFERGYCCACSTGTYGNGKDCLPKGEPQRITGSFEGVINGIPIDRTDLHTFVTATDGNVYTAVSKIPSDLGHPMMLLHAIGSVMGWLFADVQSPSVYNGFQLTGGLFNRTVTLHIGSRYYVTIKQEFSGRDIYHYFKSHVFVSGTLPDIAPGSEVLFPDYDEEFRRERPGYVVAYTGMDVVVKDGAKRETIRMTVDQQIHFDECAHKQFDRDPAVMLKVKRVHVTYDANDGIVRYGARNYATRKGSVVDAQAPPTGGHFDRRQHGQTQQNSEPLAMPSADACAPGRHACTLPHMKCRAVEPSYRCECEPGYQAEHNQASPIGWRCVDLDECTRGDHNCHQHATCTNREGSFACQCHPGFQGDGRICVREGQQLVHPAQPGPVAGNVGAGPDGACTSHQQCHQWGECVFTAEHPTGRCKCRGWYTGDGVNHCGPPDQKPQQNANIPQRGGKPCGTDVCAEHAECMPATSGGSECVCKAGYSGNGIVCEALLDENQNGQNFQQSSPLGKVCRSHEECSEHGTCAYHHSLGYYQCACTDPYVGNGVECTLPGATPMQGSADVGCDVTNDCSEFADCVYERTEAGARFKCVCQAGYAGDGKYCMQSRLAIQGLPALPQPAAPASQPGCDQLRNCGPNAQCIFDEHNRKYQCECYEGFAGDGHTCVALAGSLGKTVHPKKACREQSDCHHNAHCVIDEEGAGEYICECLAGFAGDGSQQCTASDQCNPRNPTGCHQNAQCAFDSQLNAYACKCVDGFKGDGTNCVPFAAPSTCRENPRMCHANAQCVFNQEANQHVCLCKPGSVGDGHSRCDVIDTPRCTNCSTNAHCVQATTTGGFQCKCNAGFNGNGHVCVAMTSCLDDKSLCDAHADCVPGEGGHYVCNCHYGYHGDGRSCAPDSETRGETLLIARGMAIFQRSTKAEVFGKQLIVIPHHIPVGLDFDCQQNRIVWSDITGHSIRTASLNGTDHKSFLSKELSSPEGIAVDWSSRNVYYADSLNDEIGVASLDGKYKKALITEGLVNPRSLAIDVTGKHLYYSDWHRENPHIGRIDLDGKNNRVFVNEDVHLPNGLAVLANRRELCWVDAGSHRLSCIGFNGGGRRVVFASLQYPFGLTHENEQRFYWTDWKDNRVHSVGVYGEGYGSFPISLGGSGKVFGILSVPKQCVGAATACGVDNGGCKYLCLPGQQGVHCECPDNVSVKGCPS